MAMLWSRVLLRRCTLSRVTLVAVLALFAFLVIILNGNVTSLSNVAAPPEVGAPIDPGQPHDEVADSQVTPALAPSSPPRRPPVHEQPIEGGASEVDQRDRVGDTGQAHPQFPPRARELGYERIHAVRHDRMRRSMSDPDRAPGETEGPPRDARGQPARPFHDALDHQLEPTKPEPFLQDFLDRQVPAQERNDNTPRTGNFPPGPDVGPRRSDLVPRLRHYPTNQQDVPPRPTDPPPLTGRSDLPLRHRDAPPRHQDKPPRPPFVPPRLSDPPALSANLSARLPDQALPGGRHALQRLQQERAFSPGERHRGRRKEVVDAQRAADAGVVVQSPNATGPPLATSGTPATSTTLDIRSMHMRPFFSALRAAVRVVGRTPLPNITVTGGLPSPATIQEATQRMKAFVHGRIPPYPSHLYHGRGVVISGGQVRIRTGGVRESTRECWGTLSMSMCSSWSSPKDSQERVCV